MAINKPNAGFGSVAEDIGQLTKHFTMEDYVLVVDGSSDRKSNIHISTCIELDISELNCKHWNYVILKHSLLIAI